jgi:hypothetical protein
MTRRFDAQPVVALLVVDEAAVAFFPKWTDLKDGEPEARFGCRDFRHPLHAGPHARVLAADLRKSGSRPRDVDPMCFANAIASEVLLNFPAVRRASASSRRGVASGPPRSRPAV